MINFKITIEGGGEPVNWRAGVYERVVNNAAAAQVEQLLKRHFVRKGGRKYWKDAADAVRVSNEGGQAWVHFDHRGMRLHLYGGTVRPSGRTSAVTGKPIKKLLIPTDDSPLRKRGVALYELGLAREAVHREGIKLIADMGGVPVVLGLLADKAEHKPDPSVLPGASEINDALTRGASKAINKLKL